MAEGTRSIGALARESGLSVSALRRVAVYGQAVRHLAGHTSDRCLPTGREVVQQTWQ